MSEDIEFIDVALRERRSLETALADLVAKQKRAPRPELARMIRGIEAEIVQRQPPIHGIGGACLPTLNPLVLASKLPLLFRVIKGPVALRHPTKRLESATYMTSMVLNKGKPAGESA